MIEGICNGIKIIIEEIRVRVQGHRSGGMTEHPLHRFDVRAGADREARRTVSQIVRGHLSWERLVNLPSLFAAPSEPPIGDIAQKDAPLLALAKATPAE